MWKLFLDDERDPSTDVDTWTVCRSTKAAQTKVMELGMPGFIAFDHDLGENDTAMDFLKWLVNEYWDGNEPIPDYSVHSSNPAGRQNIISYMETWWKVTNNFQPRSIMFE